MTEIETVIPQTPAAAVPSPAEAAPTPAKPEGTEVSKPTVSEPKEEPKIPLSRFQKVYEENKRLKTERASAVPQPSPASMTPEEAEADKQVRAYLTQVLEEREAASKQEIAEESARWDEKRDFYKEVDPNVKQEVLLDLVEKYSLDYTTDSAGRELHPIDVAYKIWSDFSAKEKAAAEAAAKATASKPVSPFSVKPDAGGETETVSGKSFHQLAQEAKAQLVA